MKKTKISTVMIIFLICFIFTYILGYLYLIQSIKNNHIQNEQIIFYKIQRESNKLLNSILYQFVQQKDLIKKKHKEVFSYITKQKDYNFPLDEIYNKINLGFSNKPFNIYITDENLIIKNTTYAPDIGFNLSFAKHYFDEARVNNTFGISGPVLETVSTNFFTFTDQYLTNSNRVMQISYTYANTEKQFKKIQDLIEKSPIIENSQAYVIFKEDGYIGDFAFKKFKAYKRTLEEVQDRLKKGKDLSNKINDSEMVSYYFKKDEINYRTVLFSQNSAIFNDAKIIYQIIFNQTLLKEKIYKVNIVSLTLAILGILFIYALFRVREKELLLSKKDSFIIHSVHEIKTPLTIISLNQQLRTTKYGEDKYSNKISSAIKTLQNSYDDMLFLMTKGSVKYVMIEISIGDFIQKRVNYFQSIAKEQGRKISLELIDDFPIQISEIELTRLIDNNLSNAIKYSNINSLIRITLQDKTLSFFSEGKEINNTNAIFDKYKRENQIIGGHGLGLNIVKDIALRYNIKIRVMSKNGANAFIYRFK